MAAITAAMVKALREKTDAPMMECKKALTEADGDAAKAEEILRVKLGNKASKAAARVTAEGVVTVYVSEDRKVGAILGDYVEVGCNSVLNPGTVIGPHSNIYPTSCVRGVVPANSIWKTGGVVVAKHD
jgi:3-hydroxyisobutyrate dehydrogenase-like beta-hydroxyacid dehydrogenase